MAGGKIDILVDPDVADFPRRLEAGLRPGLGIASTVGKGIGLALVGGLVGSGFALRSIIKLGNEYTGNLNSLQAVTQATGEQMRKVSEVATALGSDLSLPATSAADAAAAMLELAKGGLTVDQAMTAAKGTLQLAAAAQIDAATAAEIQSSALNQFGLAASESGRVADVLANTANAAAGEITDMGLALKYVGPISKTLNISIEDTAAAVGLLANNGIKGENAGTALRGVLASLAAPSKEAAGALKALGVQAFDGQGRFVGLRAVIDQLALAQGKMTDAAFTAAAATAFGREPLAAITALASEGGPAFTEMAAAVSRTGGAAEVAAAKTKGLGGAIEGFKSQVETAGLLIYDAIDAPLEGAVRSAAERVSLLGPAVAGGIEHAIKVAATFGPSVAAAIERRGDAIGGAIRRVLGPLTEGADELANSGLNLSIDLFEEFTDVLRRAVDVAEPVAEGIGDIGEAAQDAGGPLGVAMASLGLAGDAASGALIALKPLAQIVGALASGFGDLPGPVQSAAVAMLALKLVRGPVDDLAGSVRDRLTGAYRGFREELRLQQALLTGSSQAVSAQVGQIGLASAALEARVPVLGRIAQSYRDASAAAESFVVRQSTLAQGAAGIADNYVGLAGALRRTEDGLRGVTGVAAGTAAALGTGVRAAAGGLVSFLGGPWGAAIGVATIGLGLFAAQQQKSAEAARRSEVAQKDFARALIASGGALNDAIRDLAFKRADDEKAIGNAKTLGIAYADVTDAILGQGSAYDKLQAQLKATILAETQHLATKGGTVTALTERGKAAEELLKTLGLLSGEFKDGQQEADDYAAAQRQSGGSMLESTDAGRSLAEAMGVLSDETASADDRARALKDALDALSGGRVDYEQAVARLNDQVRRLGPLFQEAARQSAAAGLSMVDAEGGFNSLVEAGGALIDLADDLAGSMSEVAAKAFELARASGDSVPEAAEKAYAAALRSRDGFLAAAMAAGIGADQAQTLADRYGLIPEAVVTKLENPNFSKVQQELDIIRTKIQDIPNDKPIRLQALSEEAKQKLLDFGFIVRTLPDGRVEVTANTQPARDAIDAELRRPALKVIQVSYRIPPGPGQLMNAHGNYVRAYANGGIERKLTPMRTGLAAIVPPNTWRVLGDRIRDDEAYIPVNNSPRSRSILELTAQRMGYVAIRTFAEGGLATSGTPSRPVPSSVDAGLHVTNMYVTDVDELIRRQDQHRAHALLRAGVTGV